jgi:NhaP-type Na+/H+ or K+/H+ antiporter
VLIGTALTAAAAKLIFPYEWEWPLALTVGAILSATDPVAVTALMKEVGCDPRLTMIIGGESLMNDGTAIVVFKLFYHLHRGETYTIAEVAEFFLRMSVAGPCVGVAFGLVARQWSAYASRKEEEWDSTGQIVITICTAYLTFFVAEHQAQSSGVLATCAAAMVMAENIWPKVCDHGTMSHVWHTIEYIGNTLIFMLAGEIITLQ